MTLLSFDIDMTADYDGLMVDDMGEGSIILSTCPEDGAGSSVVVSVDRLRAVMAGLARRYG